MTIRNNERLVDKILIVDNFFDYFHFFKDDWKKWPYYDAEWHNKNKGVNQNWPGVRTRDLIHFDRPMLAYTLTVVEQKFGKSIFNYQPYLAAACYQLREDDTKDWIHRDNDDWDYTMLIYLGPTNTESGTNIYDDNFKEIASVPYVTNRAVLFTSRYLHMSKLNFKERYTLSLFFRLQ